MSHISKFLPIIQRADIEEIEATRDGVTVNDLGPLAEVYKTLPNWEQKAALINLIQDHIDSRFQSVMLDFLRAPDTRDDFFELTKAIALCHLDADFERFMVYYNDRRLLREEVKLRLGDTPRVTESPRGVSQAKEPKKTNWLAALSFLLLLIGPLLILIAFINQRTLANYRENGIIVTGRVTERWTGYNSNCIDVSYFDKSILDGGELYFADICEFLDPGDFRIGQSVNVVYLPEDPENNTVLAYALENENLAPAPQYAIGLVPTVAGLGLLLLMRINGARRRVNSD